MKTIVTNASDIEAAFISDVMVQVKNDFDATRSGRCALSPLTTALYFSGQEYIQATLFTRLHDDWPDFEWHAVILSDPATVELRWIPKTLAVQGNNADGTVTDYAKELSQRAVEDSGIFALSRKVEVTRELVELIVQRAVSEAERDMY